MSIRLNAYKNSAHTSPDAVYIFVHGWSMNHQVFSPLVEHLALPAYGIDLPGHGQHQGEVTTDLSSWAENTMTAINAFSFQKIHLVAWSLGGMLATLLAKQLENIASLTLISSNPKFIQGDDWQTAVPPENLATFINNLQANQKQVVAEFMQLQMRGAPQAMAAVEQVLSLVEAGGAATLAGLQAGLKILEQTDLREDFSQLTCPVHCLLGKRDALVPIALAAELEYLNAWAQVTIFDRASHAPFISHQQETLDAMQNFWNSM